MTYLEEIAYHNTFRDKRHLLILVALAQLSTHLAIDLHLQKQQKYKGHRKVSFWKTRWITNEKICLTLVLVKVFDIYFHHNFATNKKIAIAHLWHAMEPQTICHLIVKEKVAEQIILGKSCNCSSFWVTMDLLNSHNFKVAITQLSSVQQVCSFTIW